MIAQNFFLRTTNLVSTYSIVGYDSATGDLGVAVQSRYFSVGSVVPWAEANVGAIATQALPNISYGPHGLKLLREGLTVEQVVENLTNDDKGRESRQLGIVDAKGNAAAFTGVNCLEWAGSEVGKFCSAQGNILVGKEVVENIVEAFESTKGDLADRLVVALEAGEKAGGDARGRQSAALLVVRENSGPLGYGDRFIELKVEDNKKPVAELKRLLKINHVFTLIDKADSKFEEGDSKDALANIREALNIDPNNDEAYFTLGSFYWRIGRTDEAVKAFKKALSLNPRLTVYLTQFPKLGIPKLPENLLQELRI
jgi:uncharacterized Ntn-hydrolase superfamily protein